MHKSERDAIGALKAGDMAGLEMLVALYQLRAVRTAYAITGDRQSAEDVATDAFLAAYDHISQYDERRPFAPWFYRIVVNGALKAVRSRHRASLFSPEEQAALYEMADPAPGPEEEASAHELRLFMLSAIHSLPPDQRAALVLRYYLDMDEATIAETLRCPLGTVKWRLHAARERLRRSLAPEHGLLAAE